MTQYYVTQVKPFFVRLSVPMKKEEAIYYANLLNEKMSAENKKNGHYCDIEDIKEENETSNVCSSKNIS